METFNIWKTLGACTTLLKLTSTSLAKIDTMKMFFFFFFDLTERIGFDFQKIFGLCYSVPFLVNQLILALKKVNLEC